MCSYFLFLLVNVPDLILFLLGVRARGVVLECVELCNVCSFLPSPGSYIIVPLSLATTTVYLAMFSLRFLCSARLIWSCTPHCSQYTAQ